MLLKEAIIKFFIYLLLVLGTAFWDQAGGDFERYMEVYDTIFETERNFEWLFHFALLLGQYLNLEYFIVQGFFIFLFAALYLYLSRKHLNFHMMAGFLYFFVVWGVGSPRQFAAAICIFILFKTRDVVRNPLSTLFTAVLMSSIHLPAALVFTSFLIFFYVLRTHFISLLIIIGSLLLVIPLDLFAYISDVYLFGDISSNGVFFRVLPFVILSFVYFYSGVRTSITNNLAFFPIAFLSTIGLFLGFTTIIDRVYLLFFPSLLYYFSIPLGFKYLSANIVNISIGSYWCCLLTSWYFIAESAANWRLDNPFLHYVFVLNY